MSTPPARPIPAKPMPLTGSISPHGAADPACLPSPRTRKPSASTSRPAPRAVPLAPRRAHETQCRVADRAASGLLIVELCPARSCPRSRGSSYRHGDVRHPQEPCQTSSSERSGAGYGPLFRRVTGQGKAIGPDRLNDRGVARLVKGTAMAAGVRGDLSENERAKKAGMMQWQRGSPLRQQLEVGLIAGHWGVRLTARNSPRS